jgi:hypothetical protein
LGQIDLELPSIMAICVAVVFPMIYRYQSKNIRNTHKTYLGIMYSFIGKTIYLMIFFIWYDKKGLTTWYFSFVSTNVGIALVLSNYFLAKLKKED